MGEEVWTNKTVPSNVAARSGGEVVWIPVGNRGALVALGGTAFTLEMSTSYVDPVNNNTNKADALKTQGQNFMTEIVVYDIDGDKWYTHRTSGDTPPPTAEFCSVVASSVDDSTHQIYVYGGYNGLTFGQYDNIGRYTNISLTVSNDYDDVWVLSIPSFTWTKVYSGENMNARRAHRCHKVADNQMMVIGGVRGTGYSTAGGGFVRIFDLNELKFLDNYDPNGNKVYQVPKVVSDNM